MREHETGGTNNSGILEQALKVGAVAPDNDLTRVLRILAAGLAGRI